MERRLCETAALFTTPGDVDGDNVDVALPPSRGVKDPISRVTHSVEVRFFTAKRVDRSRKEACATYLRQYSKQFAEAKAKEHQSWKENEVFDRADMRKYKPSSFCCGKTGFLSETRPSR